MDKPTCETCPFWHRQTRWDATGQCRRCAPGIATSWPATTPDEWCGEHPMLANARAACATIEIGDQTMRLALKGDRP